MRLFTETTVFLREARLKSADYYSGDVVKKVERARALISWGHLVNACNDDGQPTVTHVTVEKVSRSITQAANSATEDAITRNPSKFILASEGSS